MYLGVLWCTRCDSISNDVDERIFPRVLLETRYSSRRGRSGNGKSDVFSIKAGQCAVSHHVNDVNDRYLRSVVLVKCCIDFLCMAKDRERRPSSSSLVKQWCVRFCVFFPFIWSRFRKIRINGCIVLPKDNCAVRPLKKWSTWRRTPNTRTRAICRCAN